MKEIERNPEAPQLKPRAIELLTQLCFRQENSIQKVDAIFAYGTAHFYEDLAKEITSLLHLGITDKVFLTGGIAESGVDLGHQEPESLLTLKTIDHDSFKSVRFFTETKSTNSLENVTETLKFPEFRIAKKILMVFKTHDAGRGYLTLRKFLPEAEILLHSFEVIYPSQTQPISRDNWHTFKFGISRVWGEFLRIRKYGKRGDIEYAEVRNLVEELERVLNVVG